MLWANTETGKATASRGASGTCPSCGADLIPKCGSIVSWHWAHKSCDCDKWSEPESEWHLRWKRAFPAKWQEVTIGPHRADVLCPKGVIEFQKSSISSDEILEREAFYGRMVWVVWAGDWRLRHGRGSRKCAPRFVWSPPRKSWFAANKPIFMDLGGDDLLYVDKIYKTVPAYLDCKAIKKAWLVSSWSATP
jgi:hypothetical protein